MSFGFGFGFTKIAAAIRAAFSPSSLFAANEPGVWYDPSDLSTMFQDSVGTTPVTAVEQPVGLMLDKSKGLVLGPELVPQPLNFTSGWGSAGSVTSLTTNSFTVSAAGGPTFAFPGSTGKRYRISLSGTTNVLLRVRNGGNSTDAFDIQPGAFNTTVEASGVLSGGYSLWLAATAAGTVAIDNISVRELPGNHTYQTTATSRPVLSARVNLLTKTEQFDDAVWTKTTSGGTLTYNVLTAPDGTLTADLWVENTANAGRAVTQTASFVAGTAYTASVFVKRGDGTRHVGILFGSAAFGSNINAAFELSGNGSANVSVGPATATIQSVGGGWYRCALTATATTTTVAQTQIRLTNSSTNANTTYAGDGTSGIYIWGADLRVANDGANLPPYQRVNTATNYDTAGFPHYLRFDGVDDWLVTPTITPGIDKVQVFAGVRKLSDAAVGTVLGLGASLPTQGFEVFESDTGAGSGSNNTSFNVAMGNTSFFNGDAAPFSRIAAILLDRSLPRATETSIRSNGNNKTLTILGSDATSNFLAYPLYIGRRGGTTLPFNGHIYSLIVRFGSNLPIATIENTEKYINTKTGAY